jgi:hypothetical protein
MTLPFRRSKTGSALKVRRFRSVLERRVGGGAQGIAEGEIYIKAAGRSDFLRDLAQQRQADLGDAAFLDDAGDQSHGLIAQRSNRSEKNRLHLVGAQLLGHLRRALGNQPPRRVFDPPAHESPALMSLRERAKVHQLQSGGRVLPCRRAVSQFRYWPGRSAPMHRGPRAGFGVLWGGSQKYLRRTEAGACATFLRVLGRRVRYRAPAAASSRIFCIWVSAVARSILPW